MPGCVRGCPTVDSTSYVTAWESVRNFFGPRPESMAPDDSLDLYGEDLIEYGDWLTEWNATYGGITDSPAQFGKWLIWRLSIGTAAAGNLPSRKRDHVGISCVPCPYDVKADDVRTENMLGSVPSKQDHDVYYMRVAQRGASWGFECTYSGCPYLLANGHPYFYA